MGLYIGICILTEPLQTVGSSVCTYCTSPGGSRWFFIPYGTSRISYGDQNELTRDFHLYSARTLFIFANHDIQSLDFISLFSTFYRK